MSQPERSHDIDGAATAISNLLKPVEQHTEQPTTDDADKNPETEQPEAELETSDADDTESEVERFTVKVGDDEEHLTLDELIKGNMMQRDYTRKTQEVAEKRKQLEKQEAESLAKLNQAVEDAAEILQADLDDLKSKDMLELKEYDPDAYWKKVDDVQKRAEKLQKIKEQRTEKIQEKTQKKLAEESEKLLQKIPEWLDEGKKQSEGQKVSEFLQSIGYTEQDDLSDHRLFVMARKAMLFDQLQSSKVQDKKIKQVPKSAKPAGQSVKADLSDAAMKRRKALKKTGRLRDAQAAIKDLLR